MKKLIFMVLIGLTTITSCMVEEDLDPTHTTMQEHIEWTKLDKCDMKFVVINTDDHSIKIINPQTRLLESKLVGNSPDLQIVYVMVIFFIGFLIGILATN